MDQNLSSSARRVQQALDKLGLICNVIEMPDSTRTAPEAAASVGCSVGQIVKSLIFRASVSNKPVLVLASGSNRVDEKLISANLEEAIVRANPDFVRACTGFAIGGIPPLGHLVQPITFIDKDLLDYDLVWAAAGTPHAVFSVDPNELERMTGGKVISITK